MEKKTHEKLENIAGFEKKLEELPEKITLEFLFGKPMSRCDLKKKRIYDLLQIIAYHARERLVQEFRHEYNRPHDVKQILDKIPGKGGYVKLIGQTSGCFDRLDRKACTSKSRPGFMPED